MVILITMKETNPKTHKVETIVSHGINELDGRAVILPCETIEYFISQCGARLDDSMKEYVMPNVWDEAEMKKSFNSCKSLSELEALWGLLPNTQKRQFLSIKDEIKAKYQRI